jgi:hypothetical protein
VTHTIFASHFRRPLPRWADEGACTTVEHTSEIAKQESMLIKFLKTRRAISFSTMMMMKEYPRDVMPLYAQGHSVASYLIGQHGKRAFLEFLADGMEDDDWPRAVRAHYDYENLLAMQNDWLDWVRKGRPPVIPSSEGQDLVAQAASETTALEGIAAATSTARGGRPPRPSPNVIYRMNRPDRPRDRPVARVKPLPPRETVPAKRPVSAAHGERADSDGRGKVVLEWSRPREGNPPPDLVEQGGR